MTPIFKKEDKSITANYCPISSTSVVGKMLESILSRNIQEHLERHRLVNDSQHGCTSAKSCLTDLLSFYNIKSTLKSVVFGLWPSLRALLSDNGQLITRPKGKADLWLRTASQLKLPDSPDRIIFNTKVGPLDTLSLCMFCHN